LTFANLYFGCDYCTVDGARSSNAIGPEHQVIAEGYRFCERLFCEISI